MRNQKGFTLIELVVVIVILGILAAVAVPKFVAMQDDAQKAAAQGAAAALNSGISMTKAKWLVGNTGVAGDVDIDGGGADVAVNASGWAIGGNGHTGATTAASCAGLWTALLSSNSMTAATDTSGDFQATAATPDCTFTYVANTSYTIVYESDTGVVTSP